MRIQEEVLEVDEAVDKKAVLNDQGDLLQSLLLPLPRDPFYS